MFQVIFRGLRIFRYHVTRNEVVIVVWASILLIIVGTAAYSWLEGWWWLDALYTTIISITTIGYGDFAPVTTAGRVFATLYSLAAIGIIGFALSVLAAFVIERQSTKMERILRKRRMERIAALNGHMIICGTDYVGMRIAREFKSTDIPFILIEANEDTLRQAILFLIPDYYQGKLQNMTRIEGVDLSKYEERTLPELAEIAEIPYLLDDPTDDYVLVEAGIEKAAALVTTLADDKENLSVVVGARALAARLQNTSLRIMTRVEDIRNIRKLYFSGADDVRSPAALGGTEMALHLANPVIGDWRHSVSTGEVEGARFSQIDVSSERPSWIGKTAAEVHALDNLLLLAIKRDDTFLSPPPYDALIQAGDTGIVFGHF